MKLSRISRIVQILTTLQSGHGYSVDGLTKILGVSRRTVFRDLKELQAVGVPYRFDSKTGGYTIDPEYFLPPVDLNLQEALSLLLLVHKARNHLPVPFKNSALMAGLKVENNLPDKIRQYCNATLQNISIKPDSHVPMDLLDKVFSLLQNAIRKKRKVRLHYASFYEGTDINTVLCPYHLMYNKRAWYVIGRSSMHNSVRTFKLNRIKSLQVQDKCFLKNKTFDTHEYLGKAWSMIPEGRIFYEARSVKIKICLIGSIFYPSFHDLFIRGLIQLMRRRPFYLASSSAQDPSRAVTVPIFTNFKLPAAQTLHIYQILRWRADEKYFLSRRFTTYLTMPALLISKHCPTPHQ